MRPHGRARVSARNPRAFGVCDRCNFLFNHNRLSWQFDWAGASLINKRILVCDTCNDVPQQQLRAIVVPADPIPIQNPRIQDYVNAEQNTRTTLGNSIDPVTGIPVIGGDTIAAEVLMVQDELLLEDGISALKEEGGTDLIGLEEPYTTAAMIRVTQQTGEPPLGNNTLPEQTRMLRVTMTPDCPMTIPKYRRQDRSDGRYSNPQFARSYCPIWQ